jgi:hypothetical protein
VVTINDKVKQVQKALQEVEHTFIRLCLALQNKEYFFFCMASSNNALSWIVNWKFDNPVLFQLPQQKTVFILPMHGEFAFKLRHTWPFNFEVGNLGPFELTIAGTTQGTHMIRQILTSALKHFSYTELDENIVLDKVQNSTPP